MRNMNSVRTAGLSILAASLSVAFASAHAEDDDLTRLIRPESSMRLGLGYLTEDAARFGQYSGMPDTGTYAIADINLVRREDATGRWLLLNGRNLGLDNRNLRFEHGVQGSWRYFLDYDQTPRFSQYEVNTGLLGIGHDTQTINGVGLRDKRLKTQREAISAGGQYVIGNGFDVRMRVKQDTKTGDRLFGARPGSDVFFLAEPIDHTMSQVDVVLGYANQRLQLSAGYYGSFFENGNSSLTIAPGGTANRVGLLPDNFAHQFYLDGGYNFTPATRVNFKLAKTFAYQEDSFINPATPGNDDLGAKLETTLAQVGLSARPLPKLTVIADWRHENRDDQTTRRQYFATANTGTFNGFNETRDYEVNTGKLEARYMLPAGFKLTGGIDYDEKKRDVYPTARLVTTRKHTEETAYRVELSRALSETLNGSLALIQSERTGSHLAQETSSSTTYYAVPYHLADRDREKVRARVDWMPLEVLSFQLTADAFEDHYKDGGYGVDKGRGTFWSLDAAYSFSDEWSTHAWASREYARQVNVTRRSGADWSANLEMLTEAFGLGFRGAMGSKWKVGGDLSYSHNRSGYGLAGTTVSEPLEDVKYTVATLKLFAEYAMRRDVALRLDAVHDQWSTNDWLWSNWAYSDGTTLSQDPTQETTFVGMSMRYKWR